MTPSVQARAPSSPKLRLLAHSGRDDVAAWRRGERVSVAHMLGDVMRASEAMPNASHVLNFCTDRYLFAVALLAAMVRGQVTLLPPATTAPVIASMREFAPEAYYVSDVPQPDLGIRHCRLPEGSQPYAGEMPRIAADQLIACLFTSGSTGEPQPYFKRWGSMVLDMQAEARRLGIGTGHTILGTVPPQHMYGFESTVLLPLISGSALTSERPYYPADIDEAIARVPSPAVMFTTPFHLRAWLESGDAARIETIVSATAPLSVGLAREAESRTGARLLEIYGCTETGQVATRRPTQSAEWEALDGVRTWNEGSQAMAAGGHIERPTPLMDIIEPLGDGTRFILHGRTSDMVNIAGKRNSLGYLDHQLTSIDGVDDGVFFLPDEESPDAVTRLMAFVVAPKLDAPRVLAALRERLDPAFLPRPIVMVESLPRALTGKLPREALRALASQSRPRPAKGD